MHYRTLGIAFAALLALGAAAAAEEAAIGQIKSVAGEAQVVAGGERRAAVLGDPVRMGDILQTGADGALGVVFTDQSRLTLGAGSRLEIDEYVFDPARKEGSFLSRISRGTLLYVSGLIAKFNPDASSIEAPDATIGIRGTRLIVTLEPVYIE